jgi:hypothetical protein
MGAHTQHKGSNPTWRRNESYLKAPAAASHTKPLRSGMALLPGASTLTADTCGARGGRKEEGEEFQVQKPLLLQSRGVLMLMLA